MKIEIPKIKILRRRGGWVFDFFVYKRNRVVYCKCFCLRHLRIWKEGDYFIENGGRACKKCIVSSRDEFLSNLGKERNERL